MKKYKLLFLGLIVAGISLTGCEREPTTSSDRTSSSTTQSSGGGGGGGSSGGGTSTSTSIPTGYIRVSFYKDFNQPSSGEVYYALDVLPGSKISKPADPEVVDPAFPTFLGWSYKELINTTSDLWDFDKDTVDLNIETDGNKFSIYGIWDI